MNNIINKVIAVVATVALILGFVAYNKTPEKVVGAQGQQGPQGERGLQGPAGRDGVDGKDGITKVVTQVVEKPSTTLGSVTGPDSWTEYKNNNGVVTWSRSMPAIAGASTTCSYLLPQATTTVGFVSFYASQLASTTMVEIGTDTTAYATTTSLGKTSQLPTGGGLLVLQSASSSASYNSTLVGSYSSTSPRYLNFKLGYNGITGATPATVGVCKVVLNSTTN